MISVINFEIYSLKNIGVGDFIGIDTNNNLYKVTHDPLDIQKLDRTELINFIQLDIGF